MNIGLDWWHSLHFLRPQWLWLLLLVPLLIGLNRLWQPSKNQWQQAIDPHLLKHLLVAGNTHRKTAIVFKLLILIIVALALAGPSWRQLEQPLIKPQTVPLVIVLNLSSAMTATDLPPSRLVQARSKLHQLLKQRQEGEVALVVYADDAFTVAPLSDDMANIDLFVDDLEPAIMPRDGQRADRAVQWAQGLLEQTGATSGDIVLLTNEVDHAARQQARNSRKAGYRVSVMGLGTEQGAAYTNRSGRSLHSQRDTAALQALAADGGGRYQSLTADTTDVDALGLLHSTLDINRLVDGEEEQDGMRVTTQLWQDEGYWLVLPLLLLLLPAFRRISSKKAVIAVILLGHLPWAASLQAGEPDSTLWQRPDQRQHQQLDAGVQAYREADYARAQRLFEGIDNAEGWYNQANALARQGRYRAALAAYDRALEQQPDMEDAIINRAIVEEALQQQQQQSQDNSDDADDQGSGSAESNESNESDSAGDNAKGNNQQPDQNQDDSSESDSTDSNSEDNNQQSDQNQDNSGESDSTDNNSEGNNQQSDQNQDDSGESDSTDNNAEGSDQQSDQNQDNSGESDLTDNNSEGNNQKPDQNRDDSGESDSEDNNNQQNQDSSGTPVEADSSKLDAENTEQQQQADAALQEQIAQALQEAENKKNQADAAPGAAETLTPEQQQEREQQQARQAWLQRIPDDPGALLQRKFDIEHSRRLQEGR